MVQQVVRDVAMRGKEFGQLPNSPTHEAHILGSIIVDKDAYDQARDLVPEDFYTAGNRALWQAIQALEAKGRAFNILSLPRMVHNLELDDEFDGCVDAYITTLINDTISISDVAGSVAVIQAMARCRIMAQASHKMLVAAYEGDDEGAQAIMNDMVFAIQKKTGAAELRLVGTQIPDYMEKLDYLSSHLGELRGIPTGLSDLDHLLGGLQNTDLDILAGRPGMGKSALALTIARNAAVKYAKTVAIFSLEMGRDQLFQRLLSMQSGVNQTVLKDGRLEDDDWIKVTDALTVIEEMPIYIDDTSGISPTHLKSKLRSLQSTGVQVDFVIVDYVQLMSATDTGKRSDNRVLEIGRITNDLKKIAKDMNIPILALAQLSRASESRASKVPQLSDLRESGSIEQDADVVMFIYRDDVYNPESERPNTADIIIAKHRNGPVGEVSTYFKKSHTEFVNLEGLVSSDEDGSERAESVEDNGFDNVERDF